MEKIRMIFVLALCLTLQLSFGQAYTIGQKVENFSLRNVDNKIVQLDDFNGSKAYIIVFTCNHCPYAKMYERRIINLAKNYRKEGIALIAINPNDPDVVPEDSFEAMVALANKKEYPFPYLFDEKQEIYPRFGASRTPQVYLLDKNKILKYSGAIDDFPKDESGVQIKYLENAIKAVQNQKDPDPSITKSVGCSIKKKA